MSSTRRSFLTSTLAAGALLGLAGCSSGTAAGSPTTSGAPTTGQGPNGGQQASAAATSTADAATISAFKQASFPDSKTGNTLPYNLFTPAGYDGSKSYPLVLFIADASVVGKGTTAPLTQGLGALCWASDADQAKRPCFVVAPAYDSVVVNDNSEATNYLDTTVNLVNELAAKYSIDTNRLYTTGQSMGGMMSIAMNIAYPDLFAASYLVACQWDAAKVGPMVDDKLWITVSEGDTKAYPGQNAILAALKAKGATYTQAQLDGGGTADALSQACATVAAKGTAINYTTFKAGTLPGTAQGAMEHMATWTKAYSIESIREWIFTKSK